MVIRGGQEKMLVKEIPLRDIKILENVRLRIDEGDLATLMDSIRQDGLLNPIGISPISSNQNETKYFLVHGHRRYKAIEKLGWGSLPATILPCLSMEDIYKINSVENFERVDNTEFERGRIFEINLIEFKLTPSEIASKYHTNVYDVRRALAIYHDIPNEYRTKVKFLKNQGAKRGFISASASQKIISLKRRYKLTREQVISLLELSRQDTISIKHFEAISSLMQNGVPINKAIEIVKNYTVVTVRIPIDKLDKMKLEELHEKAIGTICRNVLKTGLKKEKVNIPDWSIG